MKRFNMIDEEFTCENCHKRVTKLGYTARGLLKPIGIEKYKDTYKIIYQCDKCKGIHKNIMAKDDNIDLIIELSKNV